jgi:MFS superfamily sulfate permease-like transporter
MFSAFHLQEFAMGMSILAFLVLLKILSKRVKKLHWIGAMGPILACAIGIAAVAAGGLNKRGIKIVEKIPQGVSCDRKEGVDGRSPSGV